MKGTEPVEAKYGKTEFEVFNTNVCDEVDDSTILREVAFYPFAA